MIKTFTSALVLLGAIALTAGAQTPDGQQPAAGETYRLYNIGQGQYLSAGDGHIGLGTTAATVTLTQATEGGATYYRLNAGGGDLGGAFPDTLALGAQYGEWKFEAVKGSQHGALTLSNRNRESSADYYLYYDTDRHALALDARRPGAAYTDGQWLLVKEDSGTETAVVTLNEDDETYTTPAQATADVRLIRKFQLNMWNPLCVPFDITAEQFLTQFGDGARLAEYSNGETKTVYFTSITTPEIKAGKPYLIYPTKNGETVDGNACYTFTGVSAFTDAPADVTIDNVTYRGTFAKTSITGADKRYFFYDKVYGLYGGSTKIKAFAAYLVDSNETSAIAEWKLDTPTAIDGVTVIDGPAFDVYNAAGQKVRAGATSLEGLPSGLYIVGGKKIVK